MKDGGFSPSTWRWQPPGAWRPLLLTALLPCLLLLGGASAQAAAPSAPALGEPSSVSTGSWRVVRAAQGATSGLTAITCPTRRECLTVGVGGIILASTDGGVSWHIRRSVVERGEGPVYPCPSDFEPPPGSKPPYVCRILFDASLDAIDCPTSRACLAVGEAGNIVASVTGGVSWLVRPSGTYNVLKGIACPTSRDCLAVGGNGPDVWVGNGDEVEHTQPATILVSTNGGASWTKRSSGTGSYTALYGIACPTSRDCLAVGGGAIGGAAILASTNGAASWIRRSSGTGSYTALYGVACPTSRDCLAVGSQEGAGAILASTNGGATWQKRASAIQALASITCATSNDCLAGESAAASFLVTDDGGATWTSRSTGSDQLVFGFACPTSSSCLAVTENGAILKSPDGFTF